MQLDNSIANIAQPMRIGPVSVPNRVFLAPMSGISDRPFRQLALRLPRLQPDRLRHVDPAEAVGRVLAARPQVIDRAVLALSKGKAPNAAPPVDVQSDGRTLTVAVSLERLTGPAPRIDPSVKKRPSADVLLQRLISRKEPR